MSFRPFAHAILLALVVAILSTSGEAAAQNNGGFVLEEYKIDDGRRDEKLAFWVRRPEGVSSAWSPKGVLLYSTYNKGIASKDPMATLGKLSYLDDFAKKHQLALVLMHKVGKWDARANTEDLERGDARTMDRAFDGVARDWSRLYGQLCRKHNLPEDQGYLVGLSGGAQFAARIALRHPKHFKAVHLIVPSSFDTPTKGGASIPWLLTTGEVEAGILRARAWYEACCRENYPMIFKPVEGHGHSIDENARQMGVELFEFVLGGGTVSANRAPFVGDVVNQMVYKEEDARWLPKEQRTYLPTERIAHLWGDFDE